MTDACRIVNVRMTSIIGRTSRLAALLAVIVSLSNDGPRASARYAGCRYAAYPPDGSTLVPPQASFEIADDNGCLGREWQAQMELRIFDAAGNELASHLGETSAAAESERIGYSVPLPENAASVHLAWWLSAAPDDGFGPHTRVRQYRYRVRSAARVASCDRTMREFLPCTDDAYCAISDWNRRIGSEERCLANPCLANAMVTVHFGGPLPPWLVEAYTEQRHAPWHHALCHFRFVPLLEDPAWRGDARYVLSVRSVGDRRTRATFLVNLWTRQERVLQPLVILAAASSTLAAWGLVRSFRARTKGIASRESHTVRGERS